MEDPIMASRSAQNPSHRRVTPRNPVAKLLYTPRYRPRVTKRKPEVEPEVDFTPDDLEDWD